MVGLAHPAHSKEPVLAQDGLWQVTSEAKVHKGVQTIVYLRSEALPSSKQTHLFKQPQGGRKDQDHFCSGSRGSFSILVRPLLQGSSAVLRSMSCGHQLDWMKGTLLASLSHAEGCNHSCRF